MAYIYRPAFQAVKFFWVGNHRRIGDKNRLAPGDINNLLCPPSQKATGVTPWMNARWVPSVALGKEGVLRRVPPHEACEEVPRPPAFVAEATSAE